MRISPNFTLAELIASESARARRIDNRPPTGALLNLSRLCWTVLEPLRMKLGRPIIITSGYRGPKLNAAIGGSSTSDHVTGCAVDLQVPGVPLIDIAQNAAEFLPYDQIILEIPPRSRGWVHIGSRLDGNRRMLLTWRGGRNYEQGLNA